MPADYLKSTPTPPPVPSYLISLSYLAYTRGGLKVTGSCELPDFRPSTGRVPAKLRPEHLSEAKRLAVEDLERQGLRSVTLTVTCLWRWEE